MPDESARPFLNFNFVFPAALLVAFLIGGGGAEGPLRNGLIAAAGAFLLVWVGLDQFGRHPIPKGARLPAVVAAFLLLIPLSQLVPLPPDVWQRLPGREYAVEALRVVGAEDHWRPLSIDPEATSRAAAFLLWPLAVFLHTLRSSPSEKILGLALFVGAATMSGIIGAMQLAAGHPDWLSFYEGPNIGAASGIFANPNHQALMMSVAIVACGILIRSLPRSQRHSYRRPDAVQMVLWAGFFFFAVMALASGARAGVLLLALSVPSGLLIALGTGSILRWAAATAVIAVGLVIVVLLYPATNSLGVRESFRFGADVRYAYLPDILYTFQQYWPAGSGAGTFPTVFAPNENLDFAQRGFLNHAHNDFLEWVIDLGLLGAVWLGFAAIVFLWGIFRLFRERTRDMGLAAGGLLMLLLVAAHSLVDYPLRTMTVASLAALAMGIFLGSEKTEGGRQRSRRGLLPLVGGLLIALFMGVETLRLFMVQWALRENRQGIAQSLGPSNSEVLVRQGEKSLRLNRAALAERSASAAIIAQPMNAAGLRVLAMAREEQGRTAGPAWRAASSLGWRDAATQVWAFRQALVDSEPEVAALRADALLRTNRPPPEFAQLVRAAAAKEEFANAIAIRLRVNSPWRRTFFSLPRDAPQAEVAGVLAVLKALSGIPGELQRADGRAVISYLIKKKAYLQASDVDRLVVGDRSQGGNLISDGSFDRQVEDYRLNSTAFDWVLRKDGPSSANVDPLPPTRLNVDSDGERSAVAADQYLKLQSGFYRFSYTARSEEQNAFRVRIVCVTSSKPLAVDPTPKSSRFVPREQVFEVDEGCPLVRLIIENMASGSPATAAFDDFRIVRRETL